MAPCIEKARAIMKVMAVDMWNHKAQHQRLRLWRMYCSPQIKAYTPDGGETTGYEECDSNYAKLRADGREDWTFELTGDLWMEGNVLLQEWFFGKGIEGWKGWNVLTLNNRGEVVSFHGVVEGAQSHSTRIKDQPSNPPPVLALSCSVSHIALGGGAFDAPRGWVAA